MKEEAKKDEELYKDSPKRKVVKEVISYDEYGNKIVTLQEVEEEGPKKAPKTSKLTKKVIIDKDGKEKTVYLDDQGNIVDAKDVEFKTEK